MSSRGVSLDYVNSIVMISKKPSGMSAARARAFGSRLSGGIICWTSAYPG